MDVDEPPLPEAPPRILSAQEAEILYQAIISNNTELVAEFFQQRVEVNSFHDSQGNTPLHLAAAHSHVAMAELLLRKGAFVNDMNSEQETPLFMAYQEAELEGENPMIRLLESWGGLVDPFQTEVGISDLFPSSPGAPDDTSTTFRY
jgi:hypothetical protein